MTSSEGSPIERLRLSGHRFISHMELELDFEGIGTADRTFVARRTLGDIPVITFDDEFTHRFLGVPCLSVGHSFTKLVAKLFEARAEHLPAGGKWERRFHECTEAVGKAFDDARALRGM